MKETEASISIGPDVLADAMAHAEASPDREVCGLLLGSPGRIERGWPARNIAPDPQRSFELDPAVLFAALRAERAGGLRLLGHYHSHPSGSPVPSPRDLAAAEPGLLWLIIAGGQARLWRATAAGFCPLGMRRFPSHGG